MTVQHVANIIESWAPQWVAWERDNVGLQVGNWSGKVSRILIALDVTEQIVREAVARRADLIVSHHPVLFRPPSSITTADAVGKIVLSLAERKIALYSAHTNLDFTKGGVSFALAKALRLERIKFLQPLRGLLSKIIVFVPVEHVDRVAESMAKAGAGTIGDYENCSFRVHGTGTFQGSPETSPSVGKAGQLERVQEVRLEMAFPRALANGVVKALRTAHPYEEVAFDLYELDNSSPNYGSGATGELKPPQTLRKFLQSAKKVLDAESLRFAGDLDQNIRRVAVCGGSGSDLLPAAVAANADVFVTADVRYHTFHDAGGRIALVDAGHWETEHVVLSPLAERLRKAAKDLRERVDVFVTQYSTNPIHSI